VKCLFCGIELTRKTQKKYCSVPCQKAHRSELTRKERIRICETCGKEFVMHKLSGKAKRGEVKEGRFCSRKCKWAAQRKPAASGPIKERTWHCKICGKEMSVYGVYCSDECRKEKARREARANNSAKKHLKERPCKGCGALFTPEYGNKRRIFCSDICLHKYNRKITTKNSRKKARLNEVYYEPVNPLKVFKRDGWRCQLCGKKLNPKHRGTIRDDAPELDHIIPWACGGEHSYRNTQCACRRCNIEKGARELGQLRLFG
jgi:hypothetical protein